MIDNLLKNMSNDVKGALMFVGGLLLVLHAMNIVIQLGNYVLLGAGLVMMFFGITKGGFDKKIRRMIGG